MTTHEIIDKALASAAGRSLIASDEFVDTLLDIRSSLGTSTVLVEPTIEEVTDAPTGEPDAVPVPADAASA